MALIIAILGSINTLKKEFSFTFLSQATFEIKSETDRVIEMGNAPERQLQESRMRN